MTARYFVREIIKSLVFLESSAKSRAGLNTGICGVRNRAEGVHRLERAVAQVAENISLETVVAGASHNIDHATRGAAVFRGVAVGNDLELLHCLLGDRRAYAVDGIVGGVGAIHVNEIRTSALAAHVKAGGGR